MKYIKKDDLIRYIVADFVNREKRMFQEEGDVTARIINIINKFPSIESEQNIIVPVTLGYKDGDIRDALYDKTRQIVFTSGMTVEYLIANGVVIIEEEGKK